MEYNREINERIRFNRKDLRNISQSDAADYLGISREKYQRLESKGEFTEEQVRLLSELLDISFTTLYFGDEVYEDDDRRDGVFLMQPDMQLPRQSSDDRLHTELNDNFSKLDLKDKREILELIAKKLIEQNKL